MPSAGDRDNFSGDVEFTAPTGGFTKGKVYACTDIYGVARSTVDAAAVGLLAIEGPVWATKVTGTGKSFAVGDKVYYVSSSASVTPAATGNTLIGVALKAAGTTDTKVLIYINGSIHPTAS